MTFGLPSFPDIVTDVLAPAVTNVVKVVTAVRGAFDDGDEHTSETPLQRTNTALYGPGGSPESPPPAPTPPADNAGGLNDGATTAGDQYNKTVDGAALTDDKLATLLKQIFESNQQARDKINAILADIQAKSKQIAPEMGDPASVMAMQQYMDQKFAEIQKLLSDTQVDAKTQAAIMEALGEEYRTNGPPSEKGGAEPGTTGGGGGEGAGGGGSEPAPPPGDPGAVPPGDPGAVGTDPLTDPLAGMGPMGMGGMGMDPMSSLAGLGSALPGMLGGLGGGGGSPLDALGPALGGLGSALPGMASQFGDKSANDEKADADKFSDDKGKEDSGDKPEDEQFKDEQPAKDEQAPAEPAKSEEKGQPAPGVEQVANAAAAPAAAPGADPARTVTMPDGTPVTAPDAQRAAAMKAVLDGSSVSSAYGDQVPPAGTPVMEPVDRNKLEPGDYAQFEAKPQVMYMGNGKVWLDGQLKPVSALPSSTDFLGWTSPPATGAVAQAATPAPPIPAPAPAPVTAGSPSAGNPMA